MKLQILAAALAIANGASANAPAPSPAPETVISVRISDLIPELRKPPKVHKALTHADPAPTLPSGYGEQVARVIEENRELLQGCAKSAPEGMLRLSLRLMIAANGAARVESEGADEVPSATGCIRKILSVLHYPSHRLDALVEVGLPLILERRAL